MNTGFISEKEFREWQAAVAMQYGIETSQTQERRSAIKNTRDSQNAKPVKPVDPVSKP